MGKHTWKSLIAFTVVGYSLMMSNMSAILNNEEALVAKPNIKLYLLLTVIDI